MVKFTFFTLQLRKPRRREVQCLSQGPKSVSCVLHLWATSSPQTRWLHYQKHSADCLNHVVTSHSSFSSRNLHMEVKERNNLVEKASVHVTTVFFPLSQKSGGDGGGRVIWLIFPPSAWWIWLSFSSHMERDSSIKCHTYRKSSLWEWRKWKGAEWPPRKSEMAPPAVLQAPTHLQPFLTGALYPPVRRDGNQNALVPWRIQCSATEQLQDLASSPSQMQSQAVY